MTGTRFNQLDSQAIIWVDNIYLKFLSLSLDAHLGSLKLQKIPLSCLRPFILVALASEGAANCVGCGLGEVAGSILLCKNNNAILISLVL